MSETVTGHYAAPVRPRKARAVAILLALLGLVLASAWWRTRAIDAGLWMDEGLSIGISSHHLMDIPTVLKRDGSPPLYYMLLGLWMGVFGRTEADTHMLSVVMVVAMVPVGFAFGRMLFGLRAGLLMAVLCAFNVFLTIYGEETRMYALMALLGLIATGCFLAGFVLRRRVWLIGLALAQAVMLYTHGWAIFFGLGCLLALVPVLRVSDDRRAVIVDAALCFAVAGILFLPWVPTLLFQSAHTGAPWAFPPRFGVLTQISSGIFGNDRISLVLLVTALAGLLRVLFPDRVIPAPGGTDPIDGGPLGERELRTALVALIVIVAGTLAAAWIVSQFNPAWVLRYMAVIVGPLLMLVALAASRSGWLGVIGVVIASVFSMTPAVNTELRSKSNVRSIAAAMRSELRPGTLVIVGQPEQTPVNWYYLPAAMRFADPMGFTPDPRMLDWTDAVDRMRAADPQRTLERLIATVPVGGRVLFIRPITIGVTNWSAPWTLLVRRQSARWGQLLQSDPRLVPVNAAPWFYGTASTVSDNAVLYRKIRSSK